MPFHVLIVDDDPSTRFVYRQVLDVLGVEMDEAASGDAAMQVLHDQAPAPDLVVLDMLLPGASGMDVLTYIYTQPHLAHTHVLIITAHQHYSTTGLRPGDQFLFKPVSPRVMRQAAVEMLQIPAHSGNTRPH